MDFFSSHSVANTKYFPSGGVFFASIHLKESSKQIHENIFVCTAATEDFFILMDEIKSFLKQLRVAVFSQPVCTTLIMSKGVM